ncbi:hypothetical protein [Thalassotalea sp. Y01]|uniref:hypothetical protein n=1 Tax=Thalassotalea sp. Y01 TaxID=2729613 RepID=UPI00145CC0B8|nr:hypothetical protein [Thalassotalea sp. Y01]NMP16130.1 hypothetical protein [Thalassotalea sp. Y01]
MIKKQNVTDLVIEAQLVRGDKRQPQFYETDHQHYDNIFYGLMAPEAAYQDWLERTKLDIQDDDTVFKMVPAETYLQMKSRMKKIGVEIDPEYKQRYAELMGIGLVRN